MIPSFLLQKEEIHFNDAAQAKNLSFVDKTLKNTAGFVSATFLQWQSAKKNGYLQLLDSRVKVLFLLLFIVLVNLTVSIYIQSIIAGLVFLLCLISRIDILHIYKKVLAIGFVFGFLIFLPASLNLFTKGDNAFTIIRFSESHSWWIYTLPQEISVTHSGIQTVLRLTLKVINSVSLVLLVISTTTFERIIKSLSFFKIPDIFLLTLTLTYKFIFILSNSITESYNAIKMRWWNRGSVIEAEEIVADRIGYLFRKSWERYESVYQSMLARGFNGKVNFCYFDKLKPRDYIFIVFFIGVFAVVLIFNFNYAGNI